MRRWREAVAFFIFIKNYMQKVLMINGSPRIGGNTSRNGEYIQRK